VSVGLSVDAAMPVRVARLESSSLEPNVDLEGDFWDDCNLLFDAGLALGLGRRSRVEGKGSVKSFEGGPACSVGPGTTIVMKVSTKRDCRTFSNDRCE